MDVAVLVLQLRHEVKFIKLFKYSCYKYVSYSVNRNASPFVLKWYEINVIFSANIVRGLLIVKISLTNEHPGKDLLGPFAEYIFIIPREVSELYLYFAFPSFLNSQCLNI